MLKTIDIDAEIAKLQQLQKIELLKQHENEGMMKLFNTTPNNLVDPITKNILLIIQVVMMESVRLHRIQRQPLQILLLLVIMTT